VLFGLVAIAIYVLKTKTLNVEFSVDARLVCARSAGTPGWTKPLCGEIADWADTN
jgi:hypothetical protein